MKTYLQDFILYAVRNLPSPAQPAAKIETEVPDDYDPRPVMVNAMREEQAELRADTESKINILEERIQQLLCLESKVPA